MASYTGHRKPFAGGGEQTPNAGMDRGGLAGRTERNMRKGSSCRKHRRVRRTHRLRPLRGELHVPAAGAEVGLVKVVTERPSAEVVDSLFRVVERL